MLHREITALPFATEPFDLQKAQAQYQDWVSDERSPGRGLRQSSFTSVGRIAVPTIDALALWHEAWKMPEPVEGTVIIGEKAEEAIIEVPAVDEITLSQPNGRRLLTIAQRVAWLMRRDTYTQPLMSTTPVELNFTIGPSNPPCEVSDQWHVDSLLLPRTSRYHLTLLGRPPQVSGLYSRADSFSRDGLYQVPDDFHTATISSPRRGDVARFSPNTTIYREAPRTSNIPHLSFVGDFATD